MKDKYRAAAALALLLSSSACSLSARHAMPSSLAGSCRSAGAGTVVSWVTPDDVANRSRLDRVCAAVGPILFKSRGAKDVAGDRPELEDIAFVSWNVHVGAADVGRLVGDLQAGRVTGRKPAEIVLMLQEAVRTENVPARVPLGASVARRIGSAGQPGDRGGIEEIARDLGMSVFYVPSMRNGAVSSRYAATDRGNAILSTLPLSLPKAIELPGERQRRVAIMAGVAVKIGEHDTDLRIGVAHLDTMGRRRTLWLFGAANLRAEQTDSLVSALPTHGPIILGADLNSWLGTSEPAPKTLARLFPDTPVGERTETFLGGLVLDYMFFRPPVGWRAHFDRVPSKYGSDHYPLVGWLES